MEAVRHLRFRSRLEKFMPASLFEIPLTRIDGSAASLADYAGNVMLIVNVASKCGLTPQYEGLESLYRTYRDKGLVVLGFPANDFKGQEPGSEAEISAFCRSVYGIEFPMFAKIKVTGPDKHPLYKALTEARPKAEFKKDSPFQKRPPEREGELHWNFEKFLIDREGAVIGRFAPDTKPEDKTIVGAIETALTPAG
jgi:glutathione peroxidase